MQMVRRLLDDLLEPWKKLFSIDEKSELARFASRASVVVEPGFPFSQIHSLA